jgi:hypothetical protein
LYPVKRGKTKTEKEKLKVSCTRAPSMQKVVGHLKVGSKGTKVQPFIYIKYLRTNKVQ